MTKISLTFLGSGSAFTVGDNFHSNMLLENEKGDRLLIDCGSDIRFSLDAVGLSYQDISDVYISHLHGDHCGGLEWLGFCRKFDTIYSRPRLYLHKSLVTPLWETRLKGGMQTLGTERASLESFFEVQSIHEAFSWQSINFQCIKVTHVFNGPSELPSFGLQILVGDKKVFITTDSQFAPEILAPYYEDADLIFHDCETTTQHSGVHAHYDELKSLPAPIKKKMWLYHYNPGPLPSAKADGFLGFVKRGQRFEFAK